jgi:hypothetical protein
MNDEGRNSNDETNARQLTPFLRQPQFARREHTPAWRFPAVYFAKDTDRTSAQTRRVFTPG